MGVFNFVKNKHKVLIKLAVLIISIGLSHSVIARNDSTKITIKGPFALGITAEQKVSINLIYSPTRLSSFGVCSFYKNMMCFLETNITNRFYFEKDNYSIGERDRRIIPISGLNTGFIYTLGLLNNKTIHFVYGFNYTYSTIYLGYKSTVPSTNNSINLKRTVNFDDRFHSINLNIGANLCNKNKLGIILMGTIGINGQGDKNSHLYVHDLNNFNQTITMSKKLGIGVGLVCKLYYSLYTKS